MNRSAMVSTPLVLILSLTPTVLLGQNGKPAAVEHDVVGRAECLTCHTQTGAGFPVTHEGRETKTCLWCHAVDARIQTADPKYNPHGLEGKKNCLMCHSGMMPSIPATPDFHTDFANENCRMCHKPAAASPGPPQLRRPVAVSR